MHCEHNDIEAYRLDPAIWNFQCRSCRAFWDMPDFITMRVEQAVSRERWILGERPEYVSLDEKVRRGQEAMEGRAPSPEKVQETEIARARVDAELLEAVRSVVRKFSNVGSRDGMTELSGQRQPPIFVPSDDGESSSDDLETPIRAIIWRHLGGDDKYQLIMAATVDIARLIAQHFGSAYDKGSSDSNESPTEGTP